MESTSPSPAQAPRRAPWLKALADEALKALSDRFDELYLSMGRLSIRREMLLRATLLQALFSVRSERMLMEQTDYDLLYRWFVDLPMAGFVEELRSCKLTPHAAINGAISRIGTIRKTALWTNTQAGLAKVKVRGCREAVGVFTFAVTAYKPVRIRRLLTPAAV